MSRKGFQGPRESSRSEPLHTFESTTSTAPWLSLLEYSAKYEISISTLRRRIRSETIQFRLEEGKYLVLDEPLAPLDTKSVEFLEDPMPAAPEKASQKSTSPSSALINETVGAPAHDGVSKLLLDELKRAYAMILQEKEEQICQLREEISDLRTLVRVLEGENERLQRDQ